MSGPASVHFGAPLPDELVGVARLLASPRPADQARGTAIVHAKPYLLDMVSGVRGFPSPVGATVHSLAPETPPDAPVLDEVQLVAAIPDRLLALAMHPSARVRRRASRLAGLWSEGLADTPGGFQAFFWRRFATRSLIQSAALGAVLSAAAAPFLGWWSLMFLGGLTLSGLWLYRRFVRPRAA